MRQRTREKPGFLHGIDMSDPENFEAFKDASCYWKDTVAERKLELRSHRERLDRLARNERNGWLCRWPHCDQERYDTDPKRTKAYVVPLCRFHFEQIVMTGYSVGIRPMLTPPPPRPPQYRSQTAPGFIYYLRIDDKIKVGFASDLRSRLSQYPPHSEFLLAHKGTRADEKDIHAKLLASRTHGREWYKISDEVTGFIEQQLATHGTLDDPRPKPKTGFTVGRINGAYKI